jgi:hypothetical protein
MSFSLFVLLFAVTNGAAASALGASLAASVVAGGLAGLGAFIVLTLNGDGR